MFVSCLSPVLSCPVVVGPSVNLHASEGSCIVRALALASCSFEKNPHKLLLMSYQLVVEEEEDDDSIRLTGGLAECRTSRTD